MELSIAREMLKWIILGVGINATALLGIMAGLFILGRQLSQQTQLMWLDLRRRHHDIDRDLAEIKDLLRGQ